MLDIKKLSANELYLIGAALTLLTDYYKEEIHLESSIIPSARALLRKVDHETRRREREESSCSEEMRGNSAH